MKTNFFAKNKITITIISLLVVIVLGISLTSSELRNKSLGKWNMSVTSNNKSSLGLSENTINEYTDKFIDKDKQHYDTSVYMSILKWLSNYRGEDGYQVEFCYKLVNSKEVLSRKNYEIDIDFINKYNKYFNDEIDLISSLILLRDYSRARYDFYEAIGSGHYDYCYDTYGTIDYSKIPILTKLKNTPNKIIDNLKLLLISFSDRVFIDSTKFSGVKEIEKYLTDLNNEIFWLSGTLNPSINEINESSIKRDYDVNSVSEFEIIWGLTDNLVDNLTYSLGINYFINVGELTKISSINKDKAGYQDLTKFVDDWFNSKGVNTSSEILLNGSPIGEYNSFVDHNKDVLENFVNGIAEYYK